MTKYYKPTFDLYIPTGDTLMSKRLAEETFTRALQENFKGHRVKILNTVIVDEK